MRSHQPVPGERSVNQMEKRWTKRDVAAFLNCNERTVDRLRIPRVPIEVEPGKKPMVRYDPDEVRDWWETQKKKAKRNR